jgi:hypothetical protein
MPPPLFCVFRAALLPHPAGRHRTSIEWRAGERLPVWATIVVWVVGQLELLW